MVWLKEEKKKSFLDVIKEALHNELGYAVSNKYKNYTKQLLNAYQEGKDISLPIDLSATDHQNRVFKNIDGIKFLNHQGGCGGTRQDASTLSQLLAAYADHPNVAGITLLSLGCQHLQIDDFKNDLKKRMILKLLDHLLKRYVKMESPPPPPFSNPERCQSSVLLYFPQNAYSPPLWLWGKHESS